MELRKTSFPEISKYLMTGTEFLAEKCILLKQNVACCKLEPPRNVRRKYVSFSNLVPRLIIDVFEVSQIIRYLSKNRSQIVVAAAIFQYRRD